MIDLSGDHGRVPVLDYPPMSMVDNPKEGGRSVDPNEINCLNAPQMWQAWAASVVFPNCWSAMITDRWDQRHFKFILLPTFISQSHLVTMKCWNSFQIKTSQTYQQKTKQFGGFYCKVVSLQGLNFSICPLPLCRSLMNICKKVLHILIGLVWHIH